MNKKYNRKDWSKTKKPTICLRNVMNSVAKKARNSTIQNISKIK